MRKPVLLGTLLLILGIGSYAGLEAQTAQGGQSVRGRVNPAENSSLGSLVPGLPGMPRTARGNQVRLAGKSEGGNSIDRSTAIGVGGSFEFPDVPPGNYQVTVLPSSIPPVSIVVSDIALPELQLGTPLARVLGTVNVEGGGPQPRFQLEWMTASSNGTGAAGVRRAAIVTSGATFAAELPAGSFRVAASGLPAGFSIRSMTAATTDLLKEPLNIRVGETARVAITLAVASPPPWVRVSGHVTGRVGPLPVNTIRLSGNSLAGVLTASVNSDGSFEFPKVLPGQYEARALPSTVRIAAAIVVGNAEVRDVTLAAPALKDLVGEFVKIQPGEFMMGCSPNDTQCDMQESPPHRVGITKPFEMGKYEVTQAQWEAVMGTNPSQFKGRDRPVENVNTWVEALEFIDALNTLGDGYRYRIPTEAEWEYAARAGSPDAFPGILDSIAWYTANSGEQTHPVGQKQPNAWGLYDTLGNVSEWVADWYSPTYYAESPALDPTGPPTGSLRFPRGGGAIFSIPMWVRVSYRGRKGPVPGRDLYGIRLAREAITQ